MAAYMVRTENFQGRCSSLRVVGSKKSLLGVWTLPLVLTIPISLIVACPTALTEDGYGFKEWRYRSWMLILYCRYHNHVRP